MAQESQRVTPYLVVKNSGEALDYYGKYMNAKQLERKETKDGKIIHASFELPNGAQLMICDDWATSGGCHILPKGTRCPIDIALNFQSYEKGLKFWNTFVKDSENSKEITVEMEYGAQFWNANFGKFRCKFGFGWDINAPLSKDQKVPANPFSLKEESKESKDNTNGESKKRNMNDEEQENDEPPKKKQKLSNTNDNSKDNSNDNSNCDQMTGFKEIQKNVGARFGLFREFRVGKEDVDFCEAFKQGTSSVWEIIDKNKDKLGGKFSNVIAISPDDPNRVKRARYIPGFLFDCAKITKEELSKYQTENVKIREIGASDWYIYLHCGAYDTMAQSWENAINDMSNKGLYSNGNDLSFEHYLNDPSQTDVKDLRTLICIGVKSKE